MWIAVERWKIAFPIVTKTHLQTESALSGLWPVSTDEGRVECFTHVHREETNILFFDPLQLFLCGQRSSIACYLQRSLLTTWYYSGGNCVEFSHKGVEFYRVLVYKSMSCVFDQLHVLTCAIKLTWCQKTTEPSSWRPVLQARWYRRCLRLVKMTQEWYVHENDGQRGKLAGSYTLSLPNWRKKIPNSGSQCWSNV